MAFAFTLCFLLYPSIKSKRNQKIQLIDFVFVFLGLLTTLYLVIGYEGLVHRQGLMSTVTILSFTIPYEIIIGSTGIILLLEATRRVVGLPLVIIAVTSNDFLHSAFLYFTP